MYCKAGDFYLDPKRPAHRALISHAHADHAVKGNRLVYCTSPTRLFMNTRYGEKSAGEYHIVSFADSFTLNNVQITFYPAGHMLGSAQILMEYNGLRYLYTGDFKLSKDPSCEPFEFIKNDILITETTYADPAYAHPNAETEIEKLNSLTDKNIVIGAYVMGKAQRISGLVAAKCFNKKIMIHSDIVPFQKIYSQFQVSLGEWEPYHRGILKETNCVYIVPPAAFRRYAGNRNFYSAFATGWEWAHKRQDVSLKISDHADWNDLLALIEKTGPKKIFTVHGSGTLLKNHLAKQNIEVTELS